MPQGTPARRPQIEEFDRRQAVQIGFAREGQALPLDDMFITSPINSRVRDNLYSVLVLLPRHQRRHLRQTEQVWRGR